LERAIPQRRVLVIKGLRRVPRRDAQRALSRCRLAGRELRP